MRSWFLTQHSQHLLHPLQGKSVSQTKISPHPILSSVRQFPEAQRLVKEVETVEGVSSCGGDKFTHTEVATLIKGYQHCGMSHAGCQAQKRSWQRSLDCVWTWSPRGGQRPGKFLRCHLDTQKTWPVGRTEEAFGEKGQGRGGGHLGWPWTVLGMTSCCSLDTIPWANQDPQLSPAMSSPDRSAPLDRMQLLKEPLV